MTRNRFEEVKSAVWNFRGFIAAFLRRGMNELFSSSTYCIAED
jgi:hypothetical protein